MTDVFYRASRHRYPTAVSGDGCWLTDSTGKRYLDGSGGAAVSTLGHGNRRVIEAIKAQAEKLAFAHTAFFTNEPQEQLAEKLARRFHEEGAKVYFTSGGSEATETALKLARQYHVACGDQDRHIVISRQGSYHGATLGALGVSGTRRRALFDPMMQEWPRIASCYEYREKRDGESGDDYALRAAQALEAAIVECGPERIAAFIAEPVVGSTLGAVPFVSGYFRHIRRICDQYGILLICDEVMCGAGRTGAYFACDGDGAKPDIIVLGKGLGAGYQPLGAVLCRGDIHEAITDRHGGLEHGHTYIGHAIACAAGLAVLDEIEEKNLLQHVSQRGHTLKTLLQEQLSYHPNVGDIRVSGLMAGVEFVEDKQRKTPFSRDRGFPSAFRLAAMENGLICYPDGGNIGGDGAHILLAPPFIISNTELEELTGRLCRTVEQLLPVRAAA